uniref:Allatostatin neuropeptide n=1 Tax=Blattella germanica TaxID=6973 RepID=O96499_BLAGE|nr:allatostatin neuropeptide precursor [Blattella germanica]
MPGPRTWYSLQAALVLSLLLKLSSSAFATTTSAGTHAVQEESSAGGGAEILPRLEELADNSELDLVKRLYDFGLGKRAYSYVSEYKRLPVYNFGLGKRSKMYGFGLGKRAGSDGRLYSFGLGKRDYDDYYGDDDEEDHQTSADEDIEDADSVDLMDKRDRLYSFGLGKRARPYSFGLGKRAPSSAQRLYGFGLGKRALYSFGLGKRAGGRLYSFGLGKRPVNSGRQSGSRFNFGLGKRSDDFDIRELEGKFAEEDKRSPQEHRFSFGLGKREVAPSELEAVKNEEKDSVSNQEKKNNTNDAHIHNGERVKRSLHYPFGFGKQDSGFDLHSSSLSSEENDDIGPEEFARMVRRPFEYARQKQVPMYDFGIGKRSER